MIYWAMTSSRGFTERCQHSLTVGPAEVGLSDTALDQCSTRARTDPYGGTSRLMGGWSATVTRFIMRSKDWVFLNVNVMMEV